MRMNVRFNENFSGIPRDQGGIKYYPPGTPLLYRDYRAPSRGVTVTEETPRDFLEYELLRKSKGCTLLILKSSYSGIRSSDSENPVLRNSL